MTTATIKKIFLVAIVFLLVTIVGLIFKVFFNLSPFALKIGETTLVTIVFIFLIWAFPRLVGLYFVVVGGFSNLLVVFANGAMPVSREISESAILSSETHKYINDDTVLPFLADIFKFTIGNGDYYYFFSIGDVLATVGLLLIVLQIIIYIFTKFTKKYQASKKKDIVFSESP